jgi:hypothetical protein
MAADELPLKLVIGKSLLSTLPGEFADYATLQETAPMPERSKAKRRSPQNVLCLLILAPVRFSSRQR